MNVKDMTDNQLNVELAKLLGAQVVQTKDEKEGGGAPYYQLVAPDFKGRNDRVKENAWKSCPKFSTDPVISSELQEKLIGIYTERYVRHLGGIVSDMKSETYKWNTVAKLLTATPRQIAEAAYMTLREDI